MKKILFTLLSLAVCLAACTPEPESEAPAPATEPAETALAESTSESGAPASGSLRGDGGLGESDTAWYQIGTELQDDGTMKAQVWKLDYATNQKQVLYTVEEPATQTGDAMLRGDTVYAFVNQTMYKIPANGGEAQAVPLERQFFPVAADNHSAYSFNYDSSKNSCVGLRLDLATGQITDLPLPSQTWQVWAVGEDRFLLCHLVTDSPLPNEGEGDIYGAAIQNAVCEYDWYDPATGALEKILEEPYYGAPQADGTKKMHRFLGLRDGRLYFSWSVSSQEETVDAGAETCTLQGQDWQPVPGWQQGAEPIYVRLQNGLIRWIVGYGPSSGWTFDLETESVYGETESAATSVVAFAGDDRVLLRVFTADDQGNYHESYALANAQDYLNGTAQLTPVESEAAKTLF